jgi:large subunit ribosomal protein L18Ae
LFRSLGEILSVSEIFEKKPHAVNNYGFFVRYNSRSGTHNMYKEFRALTSNKAVEKLYADLASNHRARFSSIQIIKYSIVDDKDTIRANVKQFQSDNLAFKLMHRSNRPSSKKFAKKFKATKPVTFF